MGKFLLRTTIVTLILITASQSQAFQGCNELLRNGIYDVVKEIRSASAAERYHNDFCNEDTSKITEARAASLSASYGMFSASASAATKYLNAYQKRHCSSTDRSSSRDALTAIEKRTISAPLLTAFTSCTSAANNGLEYTLQFTEHKRGFVVNLVYNKQKDETAHFRGLHVEPVGGLACQGSINNIPGGTALEHGASYSLICRRSSTNHTTLPEIQTLIETDVGYVSITLPERNYIKAIEERFEQIREIPVGTVLDWHPLNNKSIPNGFQVCDGQPIKSGLFAGTNTPDLRGKFIRGATNKIELGAKGGKATHNLNHNHTISANVSGLNTSKVHWVQAPGGDGAIPIPDNIRNHSHEGRGSAKDALGKLENRPPYYTLIKIIRIE